MARTEPTGANVAQWGERRQRSSPALAGRAVIDDLLSGEELISLATSENHWAVQDDLDYANLGKKQTVIRQLKTLLWVREAVVAS